MDARAVDVDKTFENEQMTNAGESQKRVIKLTDKALAEEIDKLQNTRKAKLNKAGNLRNEMDVLMCNDDKTQVLNALDELETVCDDAQCAHDSLLCLLPCSEVERHEIWFKAKMLPNNECVSNVQQWLSESDTNPNDNGRDDNVNPSDSVSNVGSKYSKSSTTSCAKLKAMAERAAVLARVKVLKERHAIEEEEAKLRRRKEMLALEAELAAFEAKMEIYNTNQECQSHTHSNGKSTASIKRVTASESLVPTVNPTALEFIHHDSKIPTTQQRKKSKLLLMENASVDVRPKNIIASTHQRHLVAHKPIRVDTKDYCKQNETQTLSPTCLQLPGELLNIMSRQTEITAALVNQQRSVTLPPRDIPIFDGDPLHYRTFVKAFEQGVENKATAADSLYYLEQFTRGQPRELVQSCQHMASDHGYAVAKNLLLEHFGNPHKIATAYINKALSWQTIRTDDTKALQSYALFLRGCCNIK